MRDLVTQGKREIIIRTFAGKLIRACSPKDYTCYARKIFEFCRDEVKYVFDPNGVELIESPLVILENRVADCDSIVVLLGSLLEAIGLPCRFVTIKADMQRPGDYSHVFLECQIPGWGGTKWVAMDATMPNKPFGWSPDRKYARKTWPASRDVSEDRGGDMMGFGLNGLGDDFNEPTPMFSSGDTTPSDVPGVEFTPGVAVGAPFSMRLEPSLYPYANEQIEMNAFRGAPQGAPVNVPPEFFTRAEAPYVLAMNQGQVPAAVTRMEQEIAAVQEAQASQQLSPQVKQLLTWGGVALLAWWIWRSR